MKVALAQFIYESNTFNPVEAEVTCFTQNGTWLTDPAAIRQWAHGTDTQMQSSVTVLEAAGVETTPCFVAICGAPGGRLTAACYEQVKTTLRDRLAATMPVDAMVLHLHGAVCAVGCDDVEGDLLAMVRHDLGFDGSVVVSLDLHANVTAQMLDHADVTTAYRTAPHMDFAETGERVAWLLLSLPDGGSRTIAMAKMSALIPPTATDHLRGEFARILARARELEQDPAIVDISLFPVQPWLDVEGLGSSVVVVATDAVVGARIAQELAEEWYEQRHDWPTGLRDWTEIRSLLSVPTERPWVLVDTADATTGGSAGTSAEAITQLWLMREDLPGEVLLWVVDPAAVERGLAGDTAFELGEQKFPMAGEVIYRGSCRFRPRGRAYTGQSVTCGQAIVIAAGRLRIVVTEQGCLCSDPAFFECLGLVPVEALAVQVKSLLGWQPGYAVGPEQGLYFDGPGTTSLNFARLSFSGARRELFPLRTSPRNPISLWQST